MKKIAHVKVLFLFAFISLGSYSIAQTSRPIIVTTNWIIPGPPFGEIPVQDAPCLEIESPDYTLSFSIKFSTTSTNFNNIPPIHVSYSFDGVPGEVGPINPADFDLTYHYETIAIYEWSYVFTYDVERNCQESPNAPYHISYSLTTPDPAGAGQHIPYPTLQYPEVFNPDVFGYDPPGLDVEKTLCCPHIAFSNDGTENELSSNSNQEKESVLETKDQPTQILAIAPNPFQESFFVNYDFEKAKETIITLMDLNGKTIQTNNVKLEGTGNYQFNFQDTNLSSGLYLLRINTDEKSTTFKVLKTN